MYRLLKAKRKKVCILREIKEYLSYFYNLIILSEVKIKRVKSEEGGATTTGESSSTSHDSEGVVVRKESIGGSRSSVMGNEAITVTVSEFKAGKNAGFLKNKKIEKLFVEYRYYICVF